MNKESDISNISTTLHKYNEGQYSALNVQKALSTLIPLITEYEFEEFRSALIQFESDIEEVTFMINENGKASAYAEVMNRISNYIKAL